MTLNLDTYNKENTTLQDESLWINFINGDDNCYEVIYKKYADVLYRYGIQFTNDEEIVKDAIHDVFVNIYSHRTHLKTSVNIKFYLFTALKNCLYNNFKREIIFEKLDDDEASEILDRDAEDKIIENSGSEMEKEQTLRLLNGLTERQREVIYYRFIEELNIEEIGLLMEMNYQSVQNLIQRSLKKMRETLLWFILLFSLSKTIIAGV